MDRKVIVAIAVVIVACLVVAAVLISGILRPSDNPGNGNGEGQDTAPPKVVSTSPLNNASGVALNQAVSIAFNESINASTFSFSITPDPDGWNITWNEDGTEVTLGHNDFNATMLYTFSVTSAEDLAANKLTAGDVPNPWSWTTGSVLDVTPPTLVSTTPSNSATGVAANQSVVITFSEAMDTATFTYTVSPDPGGWTAQWSAGNSVLTLAHNDFNSSTTYELNITHAEDLAGNLLAPGTAPNPWSWKTAPQTFSVNIQGFAFNPTPLTIRAGDTVVWTNKDAVQHTVTSDVGNELNSPLLSQGTTYSHLFTTAGTYDYHCTPHPYMTARVIVE